METVASILEESVFLGKWMFFLVQVDNKVPVGKKLRDLRGGEDEIYGFGGDLRHVALTPLPP